MVKSKFIGIFMDPPKLYWLRMRSFVLCYLKLRRLPMRSWDSRTCDMRLPPNNGYLFHSRDYYVLYTRALFIGGGTRLVVKFRGKAWSQRKPCLFYRYYTECSAVEEAARFPCSVISMLALISFLDHRWRTESRGGCRGQRKKRGSSHRPNGRLSSWLSSGKPCG